MSDNDNRDLFEHEAKPKNALLDELDSLKELLDREEPALDIDDAIGCDPDIPMLVEVVDTDSLELDTAPGVAESAIPLLEEVAYPEEETARREEPKGSPGKEGDPTLPNEQELNKLIDMLVGHRLRRLRPRIREEVLEELRRLYPDVFR
jgi:hypothetical protein